VELPKLADPEATGLGGFVLILCADPVETPRCRQIVLLESFTRRFEASRGYGPELCACGNHIGVEFVVHLRGMGTMPLARVQTGAQNRSKPVLHSPAIIGHAMPAFKERAAIVTSHEGRDGSGLQRGRPPNYAGFLNQPKMDKTVPAGSSPTRSARNPERSATY
jgi:hypothetical protein